MSFNAGRLSYWFFAAFVCWAGFFVFLGIPVFHFLFSASLLKIASFCALACALQMIFAPWMFDARATAENPAGKVNQRIVVMSIWLTLTLLLFMTFLNYYPDREAPQGQATIFFDVSFALIIGISIFVILKFGVQDKS